MWRFGRATSCCLLSKECEGASDDGYVFGAWSCKEVEAARERGDEKPNRKAWMTNRGWMTNQRRVAIALR